MHRFATTLSCLLGLAALLLCAGCDVEFPDQEVRLRYDVETDTLDMLILYQGVRAESETKSALGDGQDVVDRVLGGRREFMFVDFPFNFDLDEEFDEGQSPGPEYDAFVERVELVRVGAFLDEYQRLCGFQHFRMTEVSASLADLNRMLHEALLERLDSGEFGSGEIEWWDAAEEQIWRSFVEQRTPWVTLERGHIVVRLPSSEAGAARAVEQLAESIATGVNPEELYMLPMMAANIAGLRVAGGVAKLDLGRVEGSDTVLRSKIRNGPYAPGLRDLLVSKGLELTDVTTIAEVRALFDADEPEQD